MIDREYKIHRLEMASMHTDDAFELLNTCPDWMNTSNLSKLLFYVINALRETQSLLRELINDQS